MAEIHREIHPVIAEKTVAVNIGRWYPLDHQRKHRQVAMLREHMLECDVCGDPCDSLCRKASDLVVEADIALGLRKA